LGDVRGKEVASYIREGFVSLVGKNVELGIFDEVVKASSEVKRGLCVLSAPQKKGWSRYQRRL
jgi:hypothetical protein